MLLVVRVANEIRVGVCVAATHRIRTIYAFSLRHRKLWRSLPMIFTSQFSLLSMNLLRKFWVLSFRFDFRNWFEENIKGEDCFMWWRTNTTHAYRAIEQIDASAFIIAVRAVQSLQAMVERGTDISEIQRMSINVQPLQGMLSMKTHNDRNG